ncbi:MAG: hypothetical protein ACI39E_00390 [Acutalibacteraceae bacterium]
MHFPAVVGSLAGDDTFICVVRSQADAAQLVQSFEKLAVR